VPGVGWGKSQEDWLGWVKREVSSRTENSGGGGSFGSGWVSTRTVMSDEKDKDEETKWWWLYFVAETRSCYSAVDKTILIRLNVFYFCFFWEPSGYELSGHNFMYIKMGHGCEWSLERQVIYVSVCLGWLWRSSVADGARWQVIPRGCHQLW
jgi:hypothetical protein